MYTFKIKGNNFFKTIFFSAELFTFLTFFEKGVKLFKIIAFFFNMRVLFRIRYKPFLFITCICFTIGMNMILELQALDYVINRGYVTNGGVN